MRLLADTHVWLWAVDPTERLPSRIRDTLADPANEVWLSSVSAWEVHIKVARGKLPLKDTPQQTLQLFLDAGAQPLHVTMVHATTSLPDPPATNDPFDRLLLAQCEAEGMRLLTVDDHLKDHRLAWRL